MGLIEWIRRRRRDAAVPYAVREAGRTLDAMWRETTGDPIYGEPLALAVGRATVGGERCAHCARPIRHILGQGWVHDGEQGTFGCRDTNSSGMLTGTYATPSGPVRTMHRPCGPRGAGGSGPTAAVEDLAPRGGAGR